MGHAAVCHRFSPTTGSLKATAATVFVSAIDISAHCNSHYITAFPLVKRFLKNIRIFFFVFFSAEKP